MKTVSTAVNPKGQIASRIELLVRLIYGIPLVIVMYVLQLLFIIGWVVNFFSVLIRGLRSVRVSAFLKTVLDYQYKMSAYNAMLTDERPPILPE